MGANIALVPTVLAPGLETAAGILRGQVGNDWRLTVDAPNRTIAARPYVDPLRHTVPWPYLPGDPVPLLGGGFPIGVLESGSVLRLPTVGVSWLIGGLPNSGKSMCANALTVGLAAQEHVAIIGLDPKVVEHSLWRERFSWVETDEDKMAHVLYAIDDEMERRYLSLGAIGRKKSIVPTKAMPHIVVIVDELAELTATEDSRMSKSRATTLRRIAAKGRAALISVIAITQKPSSDVVPTSLPRYASGKGVLRHVNT